MSGKKKAILIIIGILTVFAYSGCMVLQERTFIDSRVVIGITVIITIILLLLFVRQGPLSNFLRPAWLNTIVFAIIIPAFLMISFYTTNYIFSDKDSSETETAVVEKVYYKIRHKRKRINRKVYAQGEPYNVYFIDVKFSNGSVKSFEIPLRKYNKTHKGDSLSYPVERGLYNITVIKANNYN